MNMNLKNMKFGGKLPVVVGLLSCLAATAPASAQEAPPFGPGPSRPVDDMLTINDGNTKISYEAKEGGLEAFHNSDFTAPAGFKGMTVFLIGNTIPTPDVEHKLSSNLTSLGGVPIADNLNVSDALTIRDVGGKLDVTFISDGASADQKRDFPILNSDTGQLITTAGGLMGAGAPEFLGEPGQPTDMSPIFGLAPGTITVMSAVPAVPEPETYAMLLAGLGLMGAVVRRRSTRKDS